MKRVAPLCLALALVAGNSAQAQLNMQMSNGWTFTFAGNVNAFLTYEKAKDDGESSGAPGGLVGVDFQETRIRTGLLPAFAVFDAKGKEGNTDLGVHFGFAPQINCATGVHDCFGAQIDMRQVYLTVGGSWGQILAGRELGLFSRQNILTDQTLFGIGATGSAGVVDGNSGMGTTLGRIGFGYIYPQFVAQMTYSTPAGKPSQFSIGLFEAAAIDDYDKTNIPRVEAEFTYNQGNTKFWLGGTAQSVKDRTTDESAASMGVSGGVRWGSQTFSITGSGYAGKGLGTTLFGNAASGGSGTGSDDLRKSYGYIGQITFTPMNSKATFAGSFGSSYLKASEDEGGDAKTENTLVSGGIYYQATKSLKVVGELNYAWTKVHVDAEPNKNSSFAPAVGLMLFF